MPALLGDRSPQRRVRAFSMPELLVVIAIISIASTIALVSYSTYRREASVRSSAERIKSLLVEARTRAIANNVSVAATFDLTNQMIWIDEMENDTAVRKPKVVAPDYLPVDTVMEEVRINSTSYSSDIRRAIFRPDGSNSLVTVILRRENGDTSVETNYYSVQIYPASPEAKVWPNVRR